MADEDEVRLRVTQVYRAFYGNKAENLDAACEMAGISRGTFYNWLKKDFPRVVEEIRQTVVDEILSRQNEREEYLERVRLDSEAKLLVKSYALAEEGLDIMGRIMRESKSDFNAKAAFDSIVNMGRNGLKPDKSKIIINAGGKDDDAPRLPAPAARPFNALPPPDSVKPAQSVELASEMTMRKHRDGTLEKHEVQYPDVINGDPAE